MSEDARVPTSPQPDSTALVPPPLVRPATWLKPELTGWRMALAIIVALVADGLQLFLGPIGWVFSDEVIDVVAMVVTSFLIGFHVLLLPTFLLEIVPVVGMLPSWTGCVLTVIALRRRRANRSQA
jgi:hypothetical protein